MVEVYLDRCHDRPSPQGEEEMAGCIRVPGLSRLSTPQCSDQSSKPQARFHEWQEEAAMEWCILPVERRSMSLGYVLSYQKEGADEDYQFVSEFV